MPRLPKGILFDLDDTILSAYGRPDVAWRKVALEFAEQIGPLTPEDLANRIGAEALEFWSDAARHKEWRTKLDEARRIIVSRAFSGIEERIAQTQELRDAIADRFTRLREEEMKLFPGASETLDTLRDRGVRLALITNGSGDVQRGKITRFALEHRFDHIQIEGEHGFGKPEEKAYLHALSSLGLGARDVWMVGDNLEWEVAAPQRLGIFAIWHDAYEGGLPADSKIRPDRIITRLPQLLEP
ncbi:MAG: HAD-IA family hydrolase [Alphaproteobacteria bacterium]|nr:HAD-IA family hydrolase [Alphaproteobacteria bacterium]